MYEEEAEYRPRANYMEQQVEINEKMRSILIDWLVEVHTLYSNPPHRMRPEALYLTVNLIDRYLSLNCVTRKFIQLVGVVAMFVASKYESTFPPEVVNFSDMTEKAYSTDEILQMECKM